MNFKKLFQKFLSKKNNKPFQEKLLVVGKASLATLGFGSGSWESSEWKPLKKK